MYEAITGIPALAGRMDEIESQISAIHAAAGSRALTPAQRAQWDALDAEHEYRAKEIRAERLRESRAKYGSVQVSLKGSPNDIDLVRASRGTIRDGVLRALDSREARHIDESGRASVERLIETHTEDVDGTKIGRHILATGRPEYLAAFMRATADPQNPAHTPEEFAAIREVRALSINTPGSGGYAVPAVLDPTIIMTSQGNPNSIYSLARVETITTDKWVGLSSAGASWSFKAEAAEATDNSPTIAQPEVITHRADGFIPFSIEAEMDWASFAVSMSELIREGYTELLAQKLTTGTATDEPDGLIAQLDASTSPAPLVVTTAGALGAGDIYDLWKALSPRFRANSSWMASTDVENTIRQLGTTDPNFTTNLTQAGIPALFNRPFAENEYMADMPVGTAAAPLLVAGDFKGYLVAQRAGMTVESVPHLMGANRRPTGQRGFFAWARVGAGVVNPNALRILVNKTS